MAERASMIHPPIEELLSRVDAKFSLVTLAAKRARQINSYFSQLGEGLGLIVPPQVASVSRKPLSIALEEIAADKISAVYPPEGADLADADAEGSAAAAADGDLGDSLADGPILGLADEPAEDPESAGP